MKIYAPLNSEPSPLLQQVEVATFFQLPSFQIIGLPSPEVAEAKERIRSAIEASGIEFPRKRVVLNLSPASIRKRGTGLDLAMALAVLALEKDWNFRLGAWGELGLDGNVKPAGQLTRTLYVAWKEKLSHVVLSEQEFREALKTLEWLHESGEVEGDPPILVPVQSLNEAWNIISSHLNSSSRQANNLKNIKGLVGKSSFELTDVNSNIFNKNLKKLEDNSNKISLSEIPSFPLTPSLERMVGVAVTGHHHFLLLGPRGTGKSQALEWFIALHPPISAKDRLRQRLVAELGRSLLASECLEESGFFPVRRVSSQVRPAALIGGANSMYLRPGEFSLAHGGLLIADEFPEWARDSRESLREPLERNKVTLTRAEGTLEFPARFLLAANGNLCPCGGWPPHLSTPRAESGEIESFPKCQCSYSAQKAYFSRLSGPILDRIDLVAILTKLLIPQKNPIPVYDQMNTLREKVVRTREHLVQKWGNFPGLLSGAAIEALLQAQPEWLSFLSQLPLGSLRSRHKIVKLALTLSAWDGVDQPTMAHYTEAACYRPEKLGLGD